jgi:hypothetical protein
MTESNPIKKPNGRPALLGIQPTRKRTYDTSKLESPRHPGRRSIRTRAYRVRSRDGGIETLRYHHYEFDPVIVEAARHARGRSGTEDSREAAIAQLRERHSRLIRETEKVEAKIAILQRGIN